MLRQPAARGSVASPLETLCEAKSGFAGRFAVVANSIGCPRKRAVQAASPAHCITGRGHFKLFCIFVFVIRIHKVPQAMAHSW